MRPNATTERKEAPRATRAAQIYIHTPFAVLLKKYIKRARARLALAQTHIIRVLESILGEKMAERAGAHRKPIRGRQIEPIFIFGTTAFMGSPREIQNILPICMVFFLFTKDYMIVPKI